MRNFLKFLARPLMNNGGFLEWLIPAVVATLPWIAEGIEYLYDEVRTPLDDEPQSPNAFNSPEENRRIADEQFKRDFGQQSVAGQVTSDRQRKMDKMFAQDRKRYLNLLDEYNQERRDLAEEIRPEIARDRGFWNKMRGRAISDWDASMKDYERAAADWRTDRAGIMDFWGGTRDTQASLLKDLQQQQMGLARELRQAPSTVMEQARLVSDANLAQNTALAGAMGGGVSSNYANLGNIARRQQGDLLTQTSALRAAEYADRINQQSSLLGQAGNLSGALIGLGATDANLRSGIAQQHYNIMSGLGTQRAMIGDKMAGLGVQNVNVGTALQGRRQGLLGNILGGSGMASAMLNYDLGMRQQDWAERTGTYGLMLANRDRQRGLLEDSMKRKSSLAATLAEIVQQDEVQNLLSNIFKSNPTPTTDFAGTGQTQNPMQISPYGNPQQNMFSQTPYIPVA